MTRHVLLPTTTAAALLAGLLAGCSGGSPDTTSSPTGSASAGATGGGADHRGGTFTMLWQNAGTSIDTAVDYDPNWYVLRMTSDGLMAWKQVAGTTGNELTPDLATATPTATDGGKTYTFTLRKGIRFSTGAVVEPSDVAYTMTREFKVPGPGVGLYSNIVGATACIAKPKTCSLAKGVVADDKAGTVAFHLASPDPDFLQKLALPFSYVVPAGTPNTDTGTTPLPATGPYKIASYQPNKTMELVRNPRFKQWSALAQPDGYPDKIVMKIGGSPEDETTAVENGQADWMYDPPPADRLSEVSTKYARQIHINPTTTSYFMALNTRVAPFDNLKVRQALNFATDRKALVQLFGGSRLASPSCQILPPNFPAYQPNCPYTENPGTTWTAPDLAKARQLVAASGTAGAKVVVVGTPDDLTKSIDLYFVSLLKKLGYRSSLKTLAASVQYSYASDSRNKSQMEYSYWAPDYTSPANFLNASVGCAGFHPGSSASPNLSEFCDSSIQKKTEQALATQGRDAAAADAQWAQIDRLTTAQAPQVTMFTQNKLDFVSSRLGNYTYNPSVTGAFLIDQAWVQ